MNDVEEGIDVTKLKYVMYVRKSTEEKERQLRSIPDQIRECKQYAKRSHLNVVEILREEKSAKKPGQRPIFNTMIKGLNKGDYDAILAWHPDRLARNMLEGGQLIDMVDQEIIADLKFVTHHFTPDANGKMLLGMAFVLSKQYSDKLSQDVKRGVKQQHAEGKSAAPKHGYFKDDSGLYKADPKTHSLIVNAWIQRESGESLETIVSYLNDSGYYRKTNPKDSTKLSRKIRVTTQMLSRMFVDSFYYGVLHQAGKDVDLREIYDFKPVVSEEVFNKIQYMGRTQKQPYKVKRAFLPLKNMIFCDYCDYQLYAGTSTSHTGKRYLNYSCKQKLCEVNSPDNKAKKRSDPTKIATSVRSKVIFDFIYELLDGGLNFSEEEYRHYSDAITHVSQNQRNTISAEIRSLQGQEKHCISEKRRLAQILPQAKQEEDSDIYKINKEEYQCISDDLDSIQARISRLKTKISDPEEEMLSYEQFFKLSKNASMSIKAGDAYQKDAICRFIFSNLKIRNKKVFSYQLKEPFATLLKDRVSLNGRGDRT